MSEEFYIGLMSGTSLDGVDAVLADLAGGKPRLVCQQMRDRDVLLSVRLESGNMLCNPVGKAKLPFLD